MSAAQPAAASSCELAPPHIQEATPDTARLRGFQKQLPASISPVGKQNCHDLLP